MIKKLNLGCGTRYLSSWINCDYVSSFGEVVACDLRNALPFSDNEFDFVYHSHVLEHLTLVEGEALLKECKRVLNRGGILRVVVPDLELQARSYLSALEADILKKSNLSAEEHDWSIVEIIDQLTRESPGGEMLKFITSRKSEKFVRSRIKDEYDKVTISEKDKNIDISKIDKFSFRKWVRSYLDLVAASWLKLDINEINITRFRQTGEVHRWMYDQRSLSRLLIKAGFTEIIIRDAFTSLQMDWNIDGIWLDCENEQPRKPFSLYIECRA